MHVTLSRKKISPQRSSAARHMTIGRRTVLGERQSHGVLTHVALLMAIVALAGACTDESDTQPGSASGGEVATDATVNTADESTAAETSETRTLDTTSRPALPAWANMLEAGMDYVGVATIDITPTLLEPYEDLNGDGYFNGCLDDPMALGDGCDEPFEDLNRNGRYDGAFIAGFGDLRAATGVHDPITARALAFARHRAGESSDSPLPDVAVLVSLDVVGLGNDHIIAATEEVATEYGLSADQVIVSSTHNHQGPDVRGMWGKLPEWSGANPEYTARVRAAIVEAVRDALFALQPARLQVGHVALRDRSPWFNGTNFGGTHPQPFVHGLLRDIRDPVVVDDRVTALVARAYDDTTIASAVFFSGHPELVGSDNTLLSADYVHYTRLVMEASLGGTSVFVSTSLGGMMSALGAEVPLVDDNGAWVAPDGTSNDDVGPNGTAPPKWATQSSFEHAHSFGHHVAAAALFALSSDGDNTTTTLEPFQVQSRAFAVPPDNGELVLLYKLGIFDVDPAVQYEDSEMCPEYDPADGIGCLAERVWHWRLGALEAVTAPGELLPELFLGLPSEDPVWIAESEDPTLRGANRGSRYWRVHPPECDTAPWEQCQLVTELEVALGTDEPVTCPCTEMHRVPYAALPLELPPGAAAPIELMTAPYRILIGNGGDHLGYIIQASDFHRKVGQFIGVSGDHYEETVSVSYRTAARWDASVRALLSSER